MKKVALLIAVCLAIGFYSRSHAQIKVGGGLAIGAGNELPHVGIDIRGEYMVLENLGLVTSVDFWFARTLSEGGVSPGLEDSKLGQTTWNIVEAHYYFELSNGVRVYPLAGFSLAWVKVSQGDFKVSDTEFGFNIGGGGEFDLSDQLLVFVEVKGVLRSSSQFVAVLGVAYRIGN